MEEETKVNSESSVLNTLLDILALLISEALLSEEDGLHKYDFNSFSRHRTLATVMRVRVST